MMRKDQQPGPITRLGEVPRGGIQEGDNAQPGAQPDLPLSDVELIVLGHVRTYRSGVHGYQLGRTLAHCALGLPSLTLGRLYRILHRLERAGLVEGRIDGRHARLRCRFTLTERGEARFRQWLIPGPAAAEGSPEELLRRLRFAEEVPRPTLRRWLDQALHACRADLATIKRCSTPAPEPGGDVGQLYTQALRARLVAQKRWLEEVLRLVGTTHRETGTGSETDDEKGNTRKQRTA